MRATVDSISFFCRVAQVVAVMIKRGRIFPRLTLGDGESRGVDNQVFWHWSQKESMLIDEASEHDQTVSFSPPEGQPGDVTRDVSGLASNLWGGVIMGAGSSDVSVLKDR